MKQIPILLLLYMAAIHLTSGNALASPDELVTGELSVPAERSLGQGNSALWTLSDVATEYRPLHPTAVMRDAIKAQNEGRFLDALISLEDAEKNPQIENRSELTLLHASFLQQGYQSGEVVKLLTPLLNDAQQGANAHAITAMALLQQGKHREALAAAEQAHRLNGGMLPHLVLSYALQAEGRLSDAYDMLHEFNIGGEGGISVSLAREAELALTLNQVAAAEALVHQALELDSANSYVISVSGLTALISGKPADAKSAFEIALKRDSHDAKALFGLGLAEIKLGNYATGQGKLNDAHDADPNNALILTYLGRAQQQSGKMADARASWRRAQQLDIKDPMPWLYQAQAELQGNRLLDARETLREAEKRIAYRQVYRGENLLNEDRQLLQANLAEVQRRLGMDNLAFNTLTFGPTEKNATNLRNQADLLQGQRFAESARRSLKLQSLFNDRPGNLPSSLDIYGDGAGQTGASNPQHSTVSGLGSQQASYNNYDELFNQRMLLEVDVLGGGHGSNGSQFRLGVGSDTLGLSLAHLQYKSDGFAPFQNLDNSTAQAVVQWRPVLSTQLFVSYDTFKSKHRETYLPAAYAGGLFSILDHSQVVRYGFRHVVNESSELRGLWSRQLTDNANYYRLFNPFIPPFSISGSSVMHGAELQYRYHGANYATQWGWQHSRGEVIFPGSNSDNTLNIEQIYVAWQQKLAVDWQLDTQLDWGKVVNVSNSAINNNTQLARWLPKLGLVYAPDSVTHLRFVNGRSMNYPTSGDATLAPVTLAGIMITRPADSSLQLAKTTALEADRQLGNAWLLEGKIQQRRMDTPIIDWTSHQQVYFRQQIDESRLGLHWQAEGLPWRVSVSYEHEHLQDAPDLTQLNRADSVNEQNLRVRQMELRWFSTHQATMKLVWSHNHVRGTLKAMDTTYSNFLAPYQNSFDQLDADLNWQFGSASLFSAGVRNATDKRYQYAESDPLNPRFSIGRLIYANLKFAW